MNMFYRKLIDKKNIYGMEYLRYMCFQNLKSLFGLIKSPIQKRKIILSRRISSIFKSVVGYGYFKGLILSENVWWGETDKAAMLLGIYENEVLVALNNLPSKYTVFIDVGAADGYYGVGVLVANKFECSYCYEASELGQKVIHENAKKNNVLDRVIVKGLAKKDFYKEIPYEYLKKSVLLIDIEGGGI